MFGFVMPFGSQLIRACFNTLSSGCTHFSRRYTLPTCFQLRQTHIETAAETTTCDSAMLQHRPALSADPSEHQLSATLLPRYHATHTLSLSQGWNSPTAGRMGFGEPGFDLPMSTTTHTAAQPAIAAPSTRKKFAAPPVKIACLSW